MSGRIDIADLLPRPLNSRPADRIAVTACPRCRCVFVVDRVVDGRPEACCACCGHTGELPT